MTIGCRLLEFHDSRQNATIPLALLYPSEAPEQTVRFGPYPFLCALDASPVGDDLPLIVLSHGNGGTPWAYRDLAAHLVKSGFVVALPEHRGNSRNDNSLAGTMANLENRPRHLSLTIDAAFANMVIGARLARSGVGVIGHSIGGYTALSVAGGEPWAGPHETLDGQPHPVAVTADARVRSLVLLAPALFWYIPGSLKHVHIPVQLWTGDRDTLTPPSHAEMLGREVADPSLVDHRRIAGAGHFSFMSKFPPEMTRPDFPPSQDPDGFDRETLQPHLFAEITTFFRRTLS